jgi:hypothetical protein
MKKCKTCTYFVVGQVMGSCRRYPENQNKHENDWCGEHQLAMMTVPVYDILTDETKMVQMPKKRGRKKNAPQTHA